MKELVKAKRPIVYIGGGAILSNASESVRKLVDELGYPVTNTLMGLGAYPGTAEKNLGMLGMHGTYESNMAMHHADLILVLGARLDDRTTNNTKKYCPDATIVHVDIDPTTISKTIQIDVPIVGPLEEIVEDMLKYLSEHKERCDQEALAAWWEQCNNWRQQHGISIKPNHSPSEGELIKPQDVIKTLYKVTNGDAVVTLSLIHI